MTIFVYYRLYRIYNENIQIDEDISTLLNIENMVKENKNAIDFVQKGYLKAKTSGDSYELTKDKLKNLKIDTKNSKIELRNLILKQDNLFNSNYVVSLKDKKKDWDGVLIEEQKALTEKVYSLLKKGEDRITNTELLKLKVEGKYTSYKIGENVKLNAILLSSGDYRIETINHKKDYLGRWLPNYATAKNVILAIDEYKLTKKYYKANGEPKLTKDLAEHLKKHFAEITTQKGVRKGIYDIALGDENFVIEMKMASSIKLSTDAAHGQIERYLDGDKISASNFLVLVVGDKKEEDANSIVDLMNSCKKKFKCHWHYMYAK